MKCDRTEAGGNEYLLEYLRYLLMEEHARRDAAGSRERRPGDFQFDGNQCEASYCKAEVQVQPFSWRIGSSCEKKDAPR